MKTGERERVCESERDIQRDTDRQKYRQRENDTIG